MGDLRPHFVLCEKSRAWHSPVCWIKCSVPMGIASDDAHHRESLIHDVNHSSLGVAFLFRHRGVWPQCSQQPLPGPVLGKEKDNRLLVPRAVSHLQPRQEIPPGFLWDMQCLPCWPLTQLGLTLTCTGLFPKAPGKDHAAAEANTGISLPLEVFSSCGAAPQSTHCPVYPGSVKWLMLCAVHGIYLVQIAEGLGFNVHWKDIGTRFLDCTLLSALMN